MTCNCLEHLLVVERYRYIYIRDCRRFNTALHEHDMAWLDVMQAARQGTTWRTKPSAAIMTYLIVYNTLQL